MSPETPAAEVIAALALLPHPEGGWFRETFRDAASTQIFYLLEAGQMSAWHRLTNAVEVWHHYAGGPLQLRLAAPDGPAEELLLGPDIFSAQTPQIVVPRNWWQSARPLGAWTLVGCTVAPAFEFGAFELAPDGWEPG
jgi:hypothetical protein